MLQRPTAHPCHRSAGSCMYSKVLIIKMWTIFKNIILGPQGNRFHFHLCCHCIEHTSKAYCSHCNGVIVVATWHWCSVGLLYSTMLHYIVLPCNDVNVFLCGTEDCEPRNGQWLWKLWLASTRAGDKPVKTTHREVRLNTQMYWEIYMRWFGGSNVTMQDHKTIHIFLCRLDITL